MLAGLDFSDVVPVDTRADEGPAPIAHTAEFVRVHSLLYALVRRGETSPRALEVCAAAIELNAANYTAWCVTQRTVKEVRVDSPRPSDVALHVTRNVKMRIDVVTVPLPLPEPAMPLCTQSLP